MAYASLPEQLRRHLIRRLQPSALLHPHKLPLNSKHDHRVLRARHHALGLLRDAEHLAERRTAGSDERIERECEVDCQHTGQDEESGARREQSGLTWIGIVVLGIRLYAPSVVVRRVVGEYY